jgi:hypothetical protein
VYNKARWSTVANEGCLYLLIYNLNIKITGKLFENSSLIQAPKQILSFRAAVVKFSVAMESGYNQASNKFLS